MPRAPRTCRPVARPSAPVQVRRTDPSLAGQLADLAQQVARLSIDRRDPERFHIEKSDIAHELRKLARMAEVGR